MYGTTSWLVTAPVSAPGRGGFSEPHHGPALHLLFGDQVGGKEQVPIGDARSREPIEFDVDDIGPAAVIGAEWPRLSARFGNEARERRERARRKSQLKLLRTETEEFAASVERDLDQLPTIEETDRKS